MFKDILNIWKEEEFLKKVVKDFENMLKEAQDIFDKATSVFWKKIPSQEVHALIYSKDRKINEEEQKIRRRLIEHLAINPRKDFTACLVFMSIVKDAERIGDYCKNIFELSYILKSSPQDNLTSSFQDLETQIRENLKEIPSAFISADNEKAVTLMQRHGKISSQCESMIRSMIDQNFSADKTVVYTLLLRYYKRISAHIANIASAIINPVEKIDYVAEGLL